MAEQAGASTKTTVQLEYGRQRANYWSMRKIGQALGVEPGEVAEFAEVLTRRRKPQMAATVSLGRDRGRVLESLAPRRVAVPGLQPRSHQVACGSGTQYEQRPGTLTPVEEPVIRALAGTKSLRLLAVDFGVSHETVRAMLHRERASAAPCVGLPGRPSTWGS